MILNYKKLRGKIKEVYGTEYSFAKAMNIGRVSLSKRLNNELDFTSRQIKKACQLLSISPDELNDYFFADEVQKGEHTA